MSKKHRVDPPPKRLRVEEPAWNSSVAGVLGEGMQRNAKHGFVEVVVIGVRPDGAMDVLTTTKDRFRAMGIVRMALDVIAGRG